MDFALWQLWNAKRGNGTFDALCASFCPELTNREKELGSIPLITYHTPEDELHALLEDGAFLLKVKIGSDPEKNGDPEAMLAWDIGRLRTVHTAAAGFTTPYTECGRPVYYLGQRPLSGQGISAALSGCCGQDGRAGAHRAAGGAVCGDRPEPVHGLPVRVAGDECPQRTGRCLPDPGIRLFGHRLQTHCKNAVRHAGDGARGAEKRRGVLLRGPDGAACALDWNMSLAARLPRVPGLRVGVVESNGPQNYTDWRRLDAMCAAPEPPGAHRRTACTGLTEVFMGKAAFCAAARLCGHAAPGLNRRAAPGKEC
ncbi:MAG: hypothetical protein ACLRZH_16775 [Ruthenibacterium lactatiformans]